MSFETFIMCDGEGCNSRVQVQQPGQLPIGWVGLQYIQSNVILNGQNPNQPNKQVFKVLCGWRCANKVTKGFVREKINE